MPLPLLKSLVAVLKLTRNFELQMQLPMPLSVIRILCGALESEVSKVVVSKVVASKVVVVKRLLLES
jgi:hypothetical protein